MYIYMAIKKLTHDVWRHCAAEVRAENVFFSKHKTSFQWVAPTFYCILPAPQPFGTIYTISIVMWFFWAKELFG